MSDHDDTSEKRSVGRRIAGDAAHMPWWQKGLLILAVLVAAAGVVGQIVARPAAETARQQPAGEGSVTPGGSRGFIAGSPQAPAGAPVAEPERSWWEQNAPALTKAGVSFVGAFLIGWAFRIYIKTMVIFTLLAVGILLALSYFNVINIDFSAAREQYTSAAGWLTDQATRLKDAALSHLPASSTGLAGLIAGMWKK